MIQTPCRQTTNVTLVTIAKSKSNALADWCGAKLDFIKSGGSILKTASEQVDSAVLGEAHHVRKL